MIDVTKKYENMIDSFNADYILALNDSYGINYMVQSLKRIKNKESLTKKDEKLLEDLYLLSELDFNLRHGFIKIVKVNENEK